MLRCDLSLHKSTLTVPSHLFFYVLKHIEVVGFFLSFIEPFSNALKKTASQENCPFSELVSLGGVWEPGWASVHSHQGKIQIGLYFSILCHMCTVSVKVLCGTAMIAKELSPNPVWILRIVALAQMPCDTGINQLSRACLCPEQVRTWLPGLICSVPASQCSFQSSLL